MYRNDAKVFDCWNVLSCAASLAKVVVWGESRLTSAKPHGHEKSKEELWRHGSSGTALMSQIIHIVGLMQALLVPNNFAFSMSCGFAHLYNNNIVISVNSEFFVDKIDREPSSLITDLISILSYFSLLGKTWNILTWMLHTM